MILKHDAKRFKRSENQSLYANTPHMSGACWLASFNI
jgi:hypothetical protein